MKKLTPDEVKQVQLDMLEYLDGLCRSKNIEYTLIGGSLLGAIRHKGFIPWDDDIDIALKRDQYELLIQELSKENGGYALTHFSNAKVYQPFAKISDKRTIVKSYLDHMYEGIGIYIDIFPYDLLPAGEENRKTFVQNVFKRAEDLASTDFPAYASGSKWYYALARLFLRFPRFLKYHGKNQEVAKNLDIYMQQYNNSNSKEIAYLSSRYMLKEHFPKEIFEEYEDVKFEHLTVRKIKNHDVYLSQLFGEYMQLPPEKERVDHSYYKWYWKD